MGPVLLVCMVRLRSEGRETKKIGQDLPFVSREGPLSEQPGIFPVIFLVHFRKPKRLIEW